MLEQGEKETRRTLLEAQRERLQAELRALDTQGKGPAGAATPQYGKRAGDHIAEALDHRRNTIAGQNLRRQIEEIERALEKISEGTYGLCDRCGNTIGEERLAALPWANLCITCKRIEERPRRW